MDAKQNLIHDLAVKAGVRYIEGMELCNGRPYIGYLDELTEFARLVGEIARESERKRLHNSHKAI
jgi:hypothetical protein